MTIQTPPPAPPPSGHQPYYYPPPAPATPRNGFGITALVLALVGLVFGLVPFTGFLALILGMLAVVFGMIGWSRARKGIATNPNMAGTGTVLGVGAAALGIWGMTILFGAVDKFADDLDRIGEDDPAAMSDVSVTDCAGDNEFGTTMLRATVKITNSTDRTQSYMVTVGVNDADGTRVGEINAVSNSLGAGQSVTLSGPSATGMATRDTPTGSIVCTVANVSRFPS